MKNLILLFMLTFASFAQAQMDNLVNLSSEWMRTGARNGATNSTDIVVYNPAGLTQMYPGLHINFSNQSLFRNPEHTYDFGTGEGPKTYKQDGSDPLIPALYVSYNKAKWAFYGGAYIAGGGATMNYPEGSITTDMISMQAVQSTGGAYTSTAAQSLKASSLYLTFTGGAAYSLNDKISCSFALRNIGATNTAEAGMTLNASPLDLPEQPLSVNYEEKANGTGFVTGINIKCSEKLNIAAHYESRVKLDFETKQISDDFGITVDGQKNRRDLPALLAVGTSFRPVKKARTYIDLNYYFQTAAEWGKSTPATEEKEYSQLAGNVFSVGAGFEYSLTLRTTASLGGGYTKYLYDDKAGYYTRLGTYEVIQDNNANINTGISFLASDKVKLNAGYMHTFWSDNTVKALLVQPLDADVKVRNSMNAIAFGVDLAF